MKLWEKFLEKYKNMKMKSEENSQKFDQEKEKQYRGKFHWFIILQSIFIRT